MSDAFEAAGAVFARVSFDDLAGWPACGLEAALAAFRLTAARHLEKPFRPRAVPFDTAAFGRAAAAAASFDGPPRQFFERWFRPYAIRPAGGQASGQASGPASGPAPGSGHVTGYYEPVIEARRRPEPGFATPFLGRPADLVELDDAEAARIGPDGMRFARRRPDGSLAAHPDRAAIETGALAGRGLELAYVADPVDAFFAHVQGCARLVFPDGETRITYDGKSGHPFTGIGRLLVESGAIPQAAISMQAIRAWLAAHPDAAPALMRRNRSYIFFREAPVADPALGPVAAAKVPLTPMASIAVDRLIHAFGLPFHISAPGLLGPAGFHRLMIAQDTGSAIIGPARADLFFGSGPAAGAAAGAVNAAAGMAILLPAGEA